MAQLMYIGDVDKTLVDVSALTYGTVITVDDDFAARLLSAFPAEYQAVPDTSTPAPAPASSGKASKNSAPAQATADAAPADDSSTTTTTN